MPASTGARKDAAMRKIDLDHILENAVARAIGVKPPHGSLKRTPPRKRVTSHRHLVRHAA
jgi:hypothetical protein